MCAQSRFCCAQVTSATPSLPIKRMQSIAWPVPGSSPRRLRRSRRCWRMPSLSWCVFDSHGSHVHAPAHKLGASASCPRCVCTVPSRASAGINGYSADRACGCPYLLPATTAAPLRLAVIMTESNMQCSLLIILGEQFKMKGSCRRFPGI